MTQAAYGSINVPSNSKFLSEEVNRTLTMARADRARLVKTLYGSVPLVFNGLAVSATGTGLQVQVATGEGIDGAGYPVYVPAVKPATNNPAEGTDPVVTLDAADANNPRIDTICLRATTLLTDYTAVLTKDASGVTTTQTLPQTLMSYFQIVVVKGVAAASPVAPAPALATDLLLSHVTVPAGAVTLNAGNIADARTIVSGLAMLGQPNAYTATQIMPASTANAASMRVTPGVAPSAPVNGDIWSTAAGLFARINGVTQTLAQLAANVFTAVQSIVTAGSQLRYGDVNIGYGSLFANSTGNDFAYQAYHSGAGWIATGTEAGIWQVNSSGAAFFHNTSLTPGAGFSPLQRALITTTGKYVGATATTATASFNAPHGTAPTTPDNGDIWSTTTGLFARINGGNWQMAAQNVVQTFTAEQTIHSSNKLQLSFGLGTSVDGHLGSLGVYTVLSFAAQRDGVGSWTAEASNPGLMTIDGTNGVRFFMDSGKTPGGIYNPTLVAVINPLGKVVGGTPTTSTASFNAPHGTAPTSPAGGDIWTTTTGLFCRLNSTTYQVAMLEAVNVFKTQQGIVQGTTSATCWYTALIGEAAARWLVKADGMQEWGPGGAASRDTNLYRSAANTLRTDDSFVVGDTLFTQASSTTRAAFNMPHGSAPTIPSNGDVWTTTTGAYARINGATLALTSPFAAKFATIADFKASVDLITGSCYLVEDYGVYTFVAGATEDFADDRMIVATTGVAGCAYADSFGPELINDVTA